MGSNQKMGYEGQLYIGPAGATASTLLTNCTDVTYNFDFETGKTTIRGDGTVIPIETEDVTLRKASIEWTMINDITDANLATVLAAAVAGNAIAIRTKDYAAGKGFDGDMVLKMEHGEPLSGEQTYKITATPSRAAGRYPLMYV